jgi:M3 family oligoendopeptidase
VNPVSATEQGVDFTDINVETPDIERITADYRHLQEAWGAARDPGTRLAVFNEWDALRRRLASWEALTKLRFDQDTKNAERKAARESLDELSPKLTALEIEMQRLLLTSPHRKDLEERLGSHLFALWNADITAFTPAIEADLTEESHLEAQYTELLAGADLEIEGKRVNLAGIEPYSQSPDRAVRHRAQQVRSGFFAAHAAELDQIYDKLVSLRHAMARKLGFDNFIDLGYRRMHRLDYDQTDVERYRDQVVHHIVPIAHDIVRRRAGALGLQEPAFWDEAISSPLGNPAPKGDHDWIVARGRHALASVHPEIGAFYAMMIDRQLVDLKNRDGKAGGGYCTSFPDYGVPYVFANFNGTHGDVHVLVHEMGHAFQDWKSKTLPAFDYLTPTYESAEIHSMSIEYLASPFMEQFFGEDAERFRHLQLEDAMLFLPYGVAVDHFQHLVYAKPEANSADRHRMWQQMEARYLPWRRYGDLAYWAKGGMWQCKEHVYHMPFYYIDYTLALCCALQFWVRSREDYGSAVADYVALCARGGEAPFKDLVRSANLTSPFDNGALARVAAEASAALAREVG